MVDIDSFTHRQREPDPARFERSDAVPLHASARLQVVRTSPLRTGDLPPRDASQEQVAAVREKVEGALSFIRGWKAMDPRPSVPVAVLDACRHSASEMKAMSAVVVLLRGMNIPYRVEGISGLSHVLCLGKPYTYSIRIAPDQNAFPVGFFRRSIQAFANLRAPDLARRTLRDSILGDRLQGFFHWGSTLTLGATLGGVTATLAYTAASFSERTLLANLMNVGLSCLVGIIFTRTNLILAEHALAKRMTDRVDGHILND